MTCTDPWSIKLEVNPGNYDDGPGISKPYIGPGDEKEDPGLILCGPIGLGRYARHALG